MSWSAPTRETLIESLSSEELDRLVDMGVDNNQDLLNGILTRTVNFVRGFLRRSGCTMGASGTIPAELLAPAMDYAAVDLLVRAGVDVKTERTDRRTEARIIFEQVAKGQFDVEDPSGSNAESAGGPSPSVTARDRSFGRTYEEGI